MTFDISQMSAAPAPRSVQGVPPRANVPQGVAEVVPRFSEPSAGPACPDCHEKTKFAFVAEATFALCDRCQTRRLVSTKGSQGVTTEAEDCATWAALLNYLWRN
jgi:hypothetical protein